MTTGELYQRLVYFVDGCLPPESYHTYYEKVVATLEEMELDLPRSDLPPEKYKKEMEHFVERWFGEI